MQDQEIAYSLIFHVHGTLIFLYGHRLHFRPARQEPDEMNDPHLDQIDRGGLKRLKEPAGQTYGHAVLDPAVLTPPRDELKLPGIIQRLAIKIIEQGLARFIVTDEGRTIGVTVTCPVLQRDTPLPARFARSRTGVGGEILIITFTDNRKGA